MTAVRHPNAAAAGTTSGATILLIDAASREGVHLSAFTAGLIIAAAAWLRLYIGARGIIGAAQEAWQTILHGTAGGK